MDGDAEPSESDHLHDAVAGEEQALRGAPSLAEDGPRVSRDSDAGPTADTRLTAWEILEAEELNPRLRSLQAKDQHQP